MMNITSINAGSVATAAVSGEGVAMPLLADGILPEGFSNALIAQLGLLNDQNAETELMPSAQTTAPTQFDSKTLVASELLNTTDQGQDLAALVGESLPVSYNPNETSDTDAHLQAVTEAINYVAGQAKPQSETIAVAQPETTDTSDAVVVSSLMQMDLTKPSTVKQVSHQQQPMQIDADAIDPQLPETQVADTIAQIGAAIMMPAPTTPAQPAVDKTLSTDTTNKAVPVAIKTAVKIPEAEAITVKANTGEQPVLMGQGGQGQAFADDKTGFEAEPLMSEITRDDAALPRSTPVDLAKLERLAVNKDDVPAITKPLTHPDWGKEIGDRIVWMNNKTIPAAEIKLNPQHLGPITVRIDVNQDQASVSFSAQHGVVRDALEASIPKLREMLNGQNLNLADVNVAQHSSSNQSQSQAQNFFQAAKQQDQNGLSTGGDEPGLVTEELENRSALVSKGLLSMYA